MKHLSRKGLRCITKIRMRILLFMLLCVTTQSLCATDISSGFEYVSPFPGSKYHNINSMMVIRPGGPVNLDLLLENPQLLQIEGELSGIHEYDAHVCSDGKTVNIKPRLNYALDEEITVIVGSIFMMDESLNTPYTFTFHTASRLPASWTYVPEEVVSDDRDFPEVTILESNGPSQGNFFINLASDGQTGILNFDASVVEWSFDSGLKGQDFKVNRNGNLTYFDRINNTWVEMNEFAEEFAVHEMLNGYSCDNHDFQILGDGRKFMFAYDQQIIDMSEYVPGGNANAEVEGFVIQELDENDDLILEWRSWDFLLPTDNELLDLTGDDLNLFHINSLEIDTDENIFISLRHTDELIKYDRTTGEIIWRMGATSQSDFTFDNNEYFSHQHDARRLANGNILLFDNANFTTQQSRSVEYEIDLVNMELNIAWEYLHPDLLFGASMGGTNRLDNGNTVIYWGNASLDEWGARVSEVDMDGNTLVEFAYGLTSSSYRVPKVSWFFDESVAGCGDPLAENYDPDAEILTNYYCVYDLDGDGVTTADGDCNDEDDSIYPGADEIPNDGIDQDCDGEDLIIEDVDMDGYTVADGDCDDNDASINPGEDEIPYDGIDQDCDGEDLTDVDGDGFSPDDGDCDDENPDINPDAEEIPNDGIDQDCDGEDLIVGVEWIEGTTIQWTYSGTELVISGLEKTPSLLQIVSMSGSVVYSANISENTIISGESWAHGVYIVSLISTENYATFKFFVNDL